MSWCIFINSLIEATVTAVATETLPLATRLYQGTRDVHTDAENASFISDLMGGKLDLAAYRALAAQQYFIYVALEAATQRASVHAQSDSLIFDELTRVPSIEADLEFLYGADWKDQITALPATLEYVARLEDCSYSLGRYTAHAYTRYLGDLSGGQVIKTMLKRHYAVPDEALSFYHFKDIVKAKPFKDLYRERLNSLSFTEAELEDTVAEAIVAFQLNQKLFVELGESLAQ